MLRSQSAGRWTKLGGRLVVLLAFAGGVVLLLLWLAGRFAPKVPTHAGREDKAKPNTTAQTVAVRWIRLPLVETAVGSIRAVHETAVGSKLMAHVVEINLKAGQPVRAGDVLARLDDADLRAKLQQAEAAVTSAEAALAQAQSDEERYALLLKSNAVSKQDYEKAATAVRSNEAALRGAREAVNEVRATLDWATVAAPMDGIVIDKKVDAGDLVVPGQVLVTLYDPNQMQLVASVRESLAHRLQVGQPIGVWIEGIDKQCTGTISEIVPQAQAASRSFQVKVTGPCPEGVYSGMFGRLLIPLDDEDVLVIPHRAVRQVGQLELVDVLDDARRRRRAVRTGRLLDDGLVEVLSGLQAGERVVLPAAPHEANPPRTGSEQDQ